MAFTMIVLAAALISLTVFGLYYFDVSEDETSLSDGEEWPEKQHHHLDRLARHRERPLKADGPDSQYLTDSKDAEDQLLHELNQSVSVTAPSHTSTTTDQRDFQPSTPPRRLIRHLLPKGLQGSPKQDDPQASHFLSSTEPTLGARTRTPPTPQSLPPSQPHAEQIHISPAPSQNGKLAHTDTKGLSFDHSPTTVKSLHGHLPITTLDSDPDQENSTERRLLYVNAKQFHRILKRREERQRLNATMLAASRKGRQGLRPRDGDGERNGEVSLV